MFEKKQEENKEKKANAEGLKKPAPEGRGSLKEFEQQLEDCEKKSAEYLAGWQRERADFLNYKKEEMERIGALVVYANEELISKILPIMDNFDVIEKKLPEDLKKDENVKGILQIKIQLLDFLKSQGVEEIKSVGEKFDANLHEVVEDMPFDAAQGKENGPTNSSQEKSGIIIEEIQKGYKINDKLLRPAKVKIIK